MSEHPEEDRLEPEPPEDAAGEGDAAWRAATQRTNEQAEELQPHPPEGGRAGYEP